MSNQNENQIALSIGDRKKILTAIHRRVLKSHINVSGVDYPTWERELNDRKPDLLVGDTHSFEAGVRSWLQKLKSSHTAFYHGRQDRFPSQHTINATLKSFEAGGELRWMFLDVYPGGPADMAGINSGEALRAVNGNPVAPPATPSFTTGKTHVLTVSTLEGENLREVEVAVPFRQGTKSRPPLVEPKAVTRQFIAPRTGVLKIPYFSGALGLEFAEELRCAIEDLKANGIDRLVIDLRGNIGGSLGFAVLASYLCPDQRPIGYSVTPKLLREVYDKSKLPRVPMPDSKSSLILTLGKFLFRDKSLVLLTQGLGDQPFHGKIVVLVNEWTNSAGEMAASFASENGLATVIGTKTAGNVLGAGNFNVGSGYWLRLPVFGWFTWSGKCLEGTGVIPDLIVNDRAFGMGGESAVYDNVLLGGWDSANRDTADV